MEKFISAESKSALLKLGLYQIAGGCLGLIIFIWIIFTTPFTVDTALIILFTAILFFGYSIFTGWQCVKITEKALTYSYINQAIQILGIEIFGYGFQYICGISLGITLNITNSFKFNFAVGFSAITMNLSGQSNGIIIDINVIALIVFVLVDRLNNKIKTEKEIRSDTRFL
jgi:hypothetical protein